MTEFRLSGRDYIELSSLLKVLGLAESGGSAKAAVAEGLVQVNGRQELRKRCKLRSGDRIEFNGRTILVS